jgi:hypothetical protein
MIESKRIKASAGPWTPKDRRPWEPVWYVSSAPRFCEAGVAIMSNSAGETWTWRYHYPDTICVYPTAGIGPNEVVSEAGHIYALGIASGT